MTVNLQELKDSTKEVRELLCRAILGKKYNPKMSEEEKNKLLEEYNKAHEHNWK